MSAKKLYLKWGTVKGWEKLGDQDQVILKEFFDKGRPDSVILDRTDDEDKAILVKLINQFNGEIWNDWENKIMTKEEAIDYVVNYK